MKTDTQIINQHLDELDHITKVVDDAANELFSMVLPVDEHTFKTRLMILYFQGRKDGSDAYRKVQIQDHAKSD